MPSTLFTYLTSPHSALGVSPAKVMFGCSVHLFEDNALLPSCLLPPHDHKEAIFQRVHSIMDVVPTLHAQLPPWATPVPKTLFNVGDSIWVCNSKYYLSFPPVLAPHRKGPFIIKNCLNKNCTAYILIPLSPASVPSLLVCPSAVFGYVMPLRRSWLRWLPSCRIKLPVQLWLTLLMRMFLPFYLFCLCDCFLPSSSFQLFSFSIIVDSGCGVCWGSKIPFST